MKKYLKFNSRKLQIEFANIKELREFMGPGVFLTFINRDNETKWSGIPAVKYSDVKNMNYVAWKKLVESYPRE